MLCESVWDAGAFGDPGPPVPPAPAATPWRGWNKRASVADVIISGALMGLAAAGELCGDGCGSFSRFLPPPGGRGGTAGGLSRPHRPLGARCAHTTQGGGGLRALGLEGGERGEEEGGGRKGERRRATATETQGGRERAAVTERQSQGKRQRWNQIQSCPSPGHSETAIPQRPRQGRRNALFIPGCFLLPREPYHRLLHNCILTFLNSSAAIYVSTCSIANNSFGEK